MADPKIESILRRGVTEAIDAEHLRLRLERGDRLRVKLGIDPTSPNIHIGRAVLLWKLRAFQELDHQVVLIVGDFTGLIGDTSDKEAERPMLTEVQIKQNMKNYFDQAFKILDKRKTEAHYNSKWLKKLGFKEVGEMADQFGLHEFSAREVIARRLTAGKRVSLREMLYPLMQGYDSVTVKADVELGGNDQKFNLLAGRVLQRHYKQTPQDILTTDLLEGTDGRKMSSSYGNVINLTDTPTDMFGRVMSLADNLIERYFLLATPLPETEIQTIRNNHSNPKDQKLQLAKTLVAMYYGERCAEQTKEEFERVFSGGGVPADVPQFKLNPDHAEILPAIVGWFNLSMTEAKRLLEQKAISVNGQTVTDWRHPLKSGDVVRVGSHRFGRAK